MAKKSKSDKGKKNKQENGAPDDAVALSLLARLPALDVAHRDAFSSQFDDTQCAKLGAETRSSAVRDCALAWAGDAIAVLNDHALAPRVHYAPERLAWTLELVVQLQRVRALAKGADSEQQTSRTARDVAVVRAKAVKAELVEKLTSAVRARPEDLATLDRAIHTENIAESLGALGALVSDLVGRAQGNAVLGAILASTHLSAADASAARAAAETISSAKGDVELGGRAHGDRDTPAVNIVEGRITEELRVLRDAFIGARERGVPVPALIPTAPMRKMLAQSKRGGRKKPPPVEPPTPPS